MLALVRTVYSWAHILAESLIISSVFTRLCQLPAEVDCGVSLTVRLSDAFWLHIFDGP